MHFFDRRIPDSIRQNRLSPIPVSLDRFTVPPNVRLFASTELDDNAPSAARSVEDEIVLVGRCVVAQFRMGVVGIPLAGG
jgi:hypothetical protein